jgi:hypothetical protein
MTIGRRTRRTSRLALSLAAGIGLGGIPLDNALVAQAAPPTYTKDVAPILYRSCTTCHRPGGLGPMSLMTFEDARKAAADIVDAVNSGFMPPWHADAPHGMFSNDRRLSDADKQIINRWVAANTPNGDPKDLPPAPQYTAAWNIGTPDAVVSMSADYEVPAKGVIEYQYFEVPTNFTEDKWVQAIEIVPGAREVVHHVLVFARAPAPPPSATPPAPPPTGAAPQQPVLIRNPAHRMPPDPPDRERQPRATGALIASTAPGTNVQVFPEGTALRIRAGSVIVFQMHYTAHGEHAMKDRTQVGFVFAKTPPVDEIRANSFQNGSFTIPAGAAEHQVPAELGFREPVRVYGLLPHTHLRGKRWEYRLVYPDGRSEVILSVPKYDFNWQTYYMFATPLEVPAGAKIESMAWYDNSAANPSNPDATREVKWGDQTWEEMQYTGILFSINRLRLGGSGNR